MLKAQVNLLRKMLISVSCDSGVAVEMDINELITSTPEQCLNSVKGVAIIEAFEKVGAGFPKGMGDHVRNLIGAHKD